MSDGTGGGFFSPWADRAKRAWRGLFHLLGGGSRAPATEPATARAMAAPLVFGLSLYLTVVFVMAGWTVWTLWEARPSVDGLAEADAAAVTDSTAATDTTVPPPGSGAAETAAPVSGQPVVDSIRPRTVAFGAGRPVVRIMGSGFQPASVVEFDGQPHFDSRYISPELLLVRLGEIDFRAPGTVVITVSTGTLVSEPATLRVESESTIHVAWSPPLLDQQPITLEGRLFLLVLLMGGLGAVLASFNSLANYRGDGKLTESWFLYYWLSPLLGAGVAFFLYLAIRGGFLAGTEIDLATTGTPWGLVAVAGLAGMFYDKTLLKLREVFLTLFEPKDDRSGKLREERAAAAAALTVTTRSLPKASVGRAYATRLEAQGGEPPYSWTVAPPLPAGLRLDPMTGEILGTPVAPVERKSFTFEVRDMKKKTASLELELTVS